MKVDELIGQIRKSFEGIKDHRAANCTYPLVDSLMGGFSIFHLKDPSLLAFREMFPYRSGNLKEVYGFETLPDDGGLRKCLDGVLPSSLMPTFKELLATVKAAGLLGDKKVLDGLIAVSADGTGHFCSYKNACPHCMVRNYSSGRTQFYHQLLAACIVNPEQPEVFPVAAEAIIKQDGQEKNDCERNAAKRLFPLIRSQLPEEKIVVLLDALYADGPTVKALQKENMHFLTTIKEGYVLLQAERLLQEGKMEHATWYDGHKRCKARFGNGLVLNGQHRETLVNYIHYEEVDKKTGETLYANEWITDLATTSENIMEMVAVARARWKIENETFNTLKNQGYHLEHNYGHGKKYLATVFAFLMLLAFLVDQIAQGADGFFKKARAMFRTRKAFWKRVGQVFDLLPVESMNAVYRFMAGDTKVSMPKLE